MSALVPVEQAGGWGSGAWVCDPWMSGAVVSGLLLVSWSLARSTRGAPARRPTARSSSGARRGRRRWPWSRAGRRGRRERRVEAELRTAAVAERAAALLRAGVAPSLAWTHATEGVEGGPDGPEEVGAPVRAVWDLVQRTGAPAAEALEASAAGVRADAAARAAVRTALAGAEVSARTVSALPLLGLALGAALGAEPWVVLAGTGPGRVCAVLGTALLLLGRWWSARLVRTAAAAGR